jgi:hypothetical protein
MFVIQFLLQDFLTDYNRTEADSYPVSLVMVGAGNMEFFLDQCRNDFKKTFLKFYGFVWLSL